MRTSTKIKTAFVLFNLAAAIHAARTGRTTGRFFGVPYDFTMPTPGRVRDRLWNEENDSVVTPPIFGAGWSLNLRALMRRVGLGAQEEEPDKTA